jgi:hypothetical protein
VGAARAGTAAFSSTAAAVPPDFEEDDWDPRRRGALAGEGEGLQAEQAQAGGADASGGGVDAAEADWQPQPLPRPHPRVVAWPDSQRLFSEDELMRAWQEADPEHARHEYLSHVERDLWEGGAQAAPTTTPRGGGGGGGRSVNGDVDAASLPKSVRRDRDLPADLRRQLEEGRVYAGSDSLRRRGGGDARHALDTLRGAVYRLRAGSGVGVPAADTQATSVVRPGSLW